MKTVEPEWLAREDEEHGRWTTESCEPKRGIPGTSIVSRHMRAPDGDNATERCIRAHEMMHAKVSPGKDWDKWINRKIASERALTVCEELRVNLLCQRAGFDVMSHLSDGGETADGERIAVSGTWGDAVYSLIAYAGTASQKKYLTGIRRHNRVWGKALLSIAKRAIAQMEKQHYLGDTRTIDKIGIAPRGFMYTEQLAEWVDRIAGMTPPDAPKEDKTKSSIKTESEDESTTEVSKIDEEKFLEQLKRLPPKINSQVPYWGELRIKKMSMPKQTRGNIGKKRTASNIGKSPRRIHRYMTDPEKRIFDRVSHGMGGVVVIDVSGSMSLSHEQVRLLVEASPGATVIAYSDWSENRENAWILADKGRMVAEMPDGMGYGNGVDFPAIEWAVAHKQRSSSPVIWVTDGGVCGPNQGFNETLAMQCIDFCKKKKIIILPNADEAVDVLKKMQNGIKPTTKWPPMFRTTYKEKTGQRLV